VRAIKKLSMDAVAATETPAPSKVRKHRAPRSGGSQLDANAENGMRTARPVRTRKARNNDDDNNDDDDNADEDGGSANEHDAQSNGGAIASPGKAAPTTSPRPFKKPAMPSLPSERFLRNLITGTGEAYTVERRVDADGLAGQRECDACRAAPATERLNIGCGVVKVHALVCAPCASKVEANARATPIASTSPQITPSKPRPTVTVVGGSAGSTVSNDARRKIKRADVKAARRSRQKCVAVRCVTACCVTASAVRLMCWATRATRQRRHRRQRTSARNISRSMQPS
jgi:hypothetical protein